jgi:hypothetical protein
MVLTDMEFASPVTSCPRQPTVKSHHWDASHQLINTATDKCYVTNLRRQWPPAAPVALQAEQVTVGCTQLKQTDACIHQVLYRYWPEVLCCLSRNIINSYKQSKGALLIWWFRWMMLGFQSAKSNSLVTVFRSNCPHAVSPFEESGYG